MFNQKPTYQEVWTTKVKNALFPVELLTKKLVDVIVQITNPELAKTSCTRRKWECGGTTKVRQFHSEQILGNEKQNNSKLEQRQSSGWVKQQYGR
jgi:PBP1b-binding outer membrane lipoprotein LpoB